MAPGSTSQNGDGALAVREDLALVERVMSGLGLSEEQIRRFRLAPGSEGEAWDVMLQLMALDEQQALRRLSECTGLAFVPEPKVESSASAFYETIPADVARQHLVGGMRSDGQVMTVASGRPLVPQVVSIIEDRLEMPVELVLSPRGAVASLINRGYEQRGDLVTEIIEDRLEMPVELVLSPRGAVASLINRGYEQRGDLVTEIIEEMPLDQSAIESAAGSVSTGNDLLALARQTPVIRLVNMILFEALRRRASDVHIHPEETRLNIRYRIDGILHDAFSPPLSLAGAISSRLKVMTELDIANRHSPQDGQTNVRIGQKKVDIRLSVIPTIHGERIVLRLLDQTQTQLDLDTLGVSKKMQAQLMDLVDRPNGMMLVTGPTGSGKTTTLYACLGRIDRATRNVMTIEDPVEYRLEGISQMQVNAKRGVTFATGLRALLRQDPDVILVGEIRDRETAELAIQASLTGHLVLATLHTNDAPGAIPRLIDIGVAPYLVTSSLLGVLAQRLLRRICEACGGSGRDPLTPGEPCEQCFGIGYMGRLAVYELMTVNDEIRRLTSQRADGVSIREAAIDSGFRTMREDAMEKVRAGLTDEAEVFRVLH